jgi:prevent-host-death family protein
MAVSVVAWVIPPVPHPESRMGPAIWLATATKSGIASSLDSSYNHYKATGRGKMEKPVSAAAANREFSRLLQEVKKGHSYIVTSHGKPVAKIAPVGERNRFAEKARTVLLARLRAEPLVEIGRWTRDELYTR